MPEKPPFLYIGVDFFGPVAVHQGRSYVKKYGCIITCMSSRSVHVEVLLALTVVSFLYAFRRLFSLQGKVHTSFSDNGLTFMGAGKELTRTLREQNTNFLT